jgi:hypothetical protein
LRFTFLLSLQQSDKQENGARAFKYPDSKADELPNKWRAWVRLFLQAVVVCKTRNVLSRYLNYNPVRNGRHATRPPLVWQANEDGDE